ncbi:hypothetical protein ACHAWU_001107 [Discostella pseudostelligera]|uniref:Uncharacterized protein n=1 Tax=Discostella pseudostelligera TaxID=259834 RepID=A0ABD3MR41_9STRA
MNLVTVTAITLATISSSVAFTGVTRTDTASASASGSSLNDNSCDVDMPTRRETLQSWLAGAATLSTGLLASPDQAAAFPNKISNQYDDRPKQRGTKPIGLGVAKRKDMAGEEYLGLKPCGAAPNCFCSTDSVEDSPDTNIPPFKWPTNQLTSREAAFQQLYEVVKAYPPGQSNIDGGGFDIVAYDPKAGYIYVQFESLKNGYVDDFELAVIGDKNDGNVVQVRSSSRLGYLDFGVNAKRINYLAKELRSKGWDAPGVQLETHRGYAEENGVKAF